MEIYFSYFKLTPCIKGIFALNDERVSDKAHYLPEIARQLNYLKSRALVFSLKFE